MHLYNEFLKFVHDAGLSAGEVWGWFFGAIGCVWGFGKLMWGWMNKGTQIVLKINTIYNELIPNGGHSLKDQITRIDCKQTSCGQLSDSPIFEADHNGRIIKVNRALCTLFFAQPDQLMGLGLFNWLHEDDCEEAKEKYQEALKSDDVFSGRFKLKNSQLIEIHVIFSRRDDKLITVNGRIKEL